MTRIDFYILPDTERQARFSFACKLAAKAASLGHNIYVHCDNQSDAISIKHIFDTENAKRFLPNIIIDNQTDNEATESLAIKLPPIQIAYGECKSPHHDILINTSTARPEFFAAFDRLSEIVIQEDSILTATRDSYKFYQHRNYPLHRHDMR